MGLLTEYIEKNLTTEEKEAELLRLIQQYNAYRKTFLLVFSADWEKPVPNTSLSMQDYHIIADFLRGAKGKSIDIYLETPGGSGEAAEEIVELLHDKFDAVNFVISGEAKSAGTIMTLAGHEIFMTEQGSLGPIDAQMKIGRSVVSAYDYMQWVKEKRDEADKNQKLNPFDATMVAQISPGELNGVDNALNFAVDLVQEWLPKYKFENWEKTETKSTSVTSVMKTKRAKEIVENLINHKKWRSHGRSLKIHDLETLGLRVNKIDDDPKFADIVYRIQTIIKLLYSTTNIYKIFATENDKLFHFFGISNPGPQNITKETEVVTANVTCKKCGSAYNFYAKFIQNKKIDEDFNRQGLEQFPKDNLYKCKKCGAELRLEKIRDDIESQSGKKIID